MTRDEFETVLEAVDQLGDEFEPYFRLLLETYWATGCRTSELVGCMARDREEWGYGQVKAHHGLRPCDIRPNYRLQIEGKNSAPDNGGELKERTVLVADSEVWERLRDWGRKREEQDKRFFFVGTVDGQERLQYRIRKLREYLSGRLANFQIRWLRHSHAIHALRNGLDLVSLQRQLGHEDLQTTANYLKYAGLDEDAYLQAFGGKPPESEVECPSCGFHWNETGPDWQTRMGRAMRRRR